MVPLLSCACTLQSLTAPERLCVSAARAQAKQRAMRHAKRRAFVQCAGRQAVCTSWVGRNHGRAERETIRQHESRARARKRRCVVEGRSRRAGSQLFPFLLWQNCGVDAMRIGAPPQARMHYRYYFATSGIVISHLDRYSTVTVNAWSAFIPDNDSPFGSITLRPRKRERRAFCDGARGDTRPGVPGYPRHELDFGLSSK